MRSKENRFMVIRHVLLGVILAVWPVFSQSVTVHLLDPWDSEANGLEVRIRGGATGYYPGEMMTAEGGGWYSITLSLTGVPDHQGFYFASGITNSYTDFLGPAGFAGDQLSDATGWNWQNVFADCGTAEVWIISKPAGAPDLLCNKPDSKMLFVFNPWPASGPEIKAGAEAYAPMKLAQDAFGNPLCGWFVYFFNNVEQYTVNLREIIGQVSVYGAAGIGDAAAIDLTAQYALQDTLYLLPTPQPTATVQAGAPQVLASLPPNVLGQCSYDLAFTVRDFSVTHPDMYDGSLTGQAVQENMVDITLGTDRKPKAGPVTQNATRLEQDWFKDVPGVNFTTCKDVPMSKTEDGYWKFDSYYTNVDGTPSANHQFYPIDDFNPFNELHNQTNYKIKRGENFIQNWASVDPPEPHNFHFCMEMHADFVYEPGQVFKFTGDDDVWAFVNYQLALDLGNIHDAAEGTINLDYMGLSAGEKYAFDFFYCERQPPGSNMMIKTSIYFEQESNYFYKEVLLPGDAVRYDLYSRSGGGGGCNVIGEVVIAPEHSVFVLTNSTGTVNLNLNAGVPPAGIRIIADTAVVIDTAAIRSSGSLEPGTYSISMTSTTLAPAQRTHIVTFTIKADVQLSFEDNRPDTARLGTLVPVVIQAVNPATMAPAGAGFRLSGSPGLAIYSDAAGITQVPGTAVLQTDPATGKYTVYVKNDPSIMTEITLTLNLHSEFGAAVADQKNITFGAAGLQIVKTPVDTMAGILVPVTIQSRFMGLPSQEPFTLSGAPGLLIYDADGTTPITTSTVLTTGADGNYMVYVTGPVTAPKDSTYSLSAHRAASGAVQDTHPSLTFRIPRIQIDNIPVDTLAGVLVPVTITSVFQGVVSQQGFSLIPAPGLLVFDSDGITPLKLSDMRTTDANGSYRVYVTGSVTAPNDSTYSLSVTRPGAGAEAVHGSLTFRIPKLRFVDPVSGIPLAPLPEISTKALTDYPVRIELYTVQWGTCTQCTETLSLTADALVFSETAGGPAVTQVTPVNGFADFVLSAQGVMQRIEFVVRGTSPGTQAVWISEIMVSYEVKRAWIVDGDRDGRADSVFIHFAEEIFKLPGTVSSIDWPAEGEGNRLGRYIKGKPDSTNISRLSDSIIVIDLSGDPFEFGQTGIPEGAQPTLALPDRTADIEDGVGAVILSAEITGPRFERYVLASDPGRIIHTNPDTLVITLSEPLAAKPDWGPEPWKSLFMVIEGCSEDNEALPLPMERPAVFDGAQVRVPVSATAFDFQVHVGDCIYMRSTGAYTDLAGNAPTNLEAQVAGEESGFKNLKTTLLRNIVGSGGIYESEFNNPDATPIPILDDDLRETGEELSGGTMTEWIPPMYMTEDGAIDQGAQAVCDPSRRQSGAPRLFPENCLSAVVVISDTAYSAEIEIYDNLGKFIHASRQMFGHCGELDQPERLQSGGFVSFLIWNQKDADGAYVGSGVYLWRVKYGFKGGKGRTEIYRQGIVRNARPEEGCAVR